MGTIVPRTRRDGTVGYTAQIRIMRGGKKAHSETRTFDRKGAAAVWLRRREEELGEPGALARARLEDPPLAAVIDRYVAEAGRPLGKTKAQVLRTIKAHDFAQRACSTIDSVALVAFVRDLDMLPQTRGNYLSHLSSIFAIAKPAWGYPLEAQAVRDAATVLRKLKLVGRSRGRDRRPTRDELDKLLDHFAARQRRAPHAAPMVAIILAAIFSTRRQEEITRLTWADFREDEARVLVRDMKNPDEKTGNDVWCDLTPEAVGILAAMPRVDERIFPVTTDAISAAFTRACKLLGIEDLHFHDLRHDGISRLFEMGWTIPRVAVVSGHRSWQSLQRYTHVRQVGDKYLKWRWLGFTTTRASAES